MKRFLYNLWDGTQTPFTLKKREIIDRFLEDIMKGMSPGMSLAQMLWQGFPLAGMDFRVMGLDEMIEMLETRKEEIFSKYNLEKIFDQPIEDLKQLLHEEGIQRYEAGQTPPPAYNQLSPGLLEKIRDLEHFDFKNSESKTLFESWRRRQQDILDLYEFYSEYAQRFKGRQYLTFEQALELMRRFKDLDHLQQQLMNAEFDAIESEQLKHLLGEDAQQSFNILLQLPRVMTEEGLAKIEKHRLIMTPKGMRALGETAFGKLVRHLRRDRQGQSQGQAPQSGEVEPDSSRPYQYGDRFDLDLTRTILNALPRQNGREGGLRLTPDDFYMREREQLITATTIVLLDLSWSMSMGGRFEAAKKVALALHHYIRTRFPRDKIHVIGFSTEAEELKDQELALAVWDAYRPFTNLQGGLQLAMQLIRRSGNRNNRVLVITDGQPTAYYINGELHAE
ncbi:MAG: VWA domain-containing protein, partial [Desulfobacteraceae bacterium]|nr:VWA domain-containing protein [Desulfobacteraceae bacterium]